MKRRRTCDEAVNEWKRLLAVHETIFPSVAITDRQEQQNDPGQDPFDCSDVGVPPTFDLVERAVEVFQRKWQQLDDRKVAEHPKKVRFSAEASETSETVEPKGGGWRLVEDRLRLPPNFDYATKGPEPEDNGTGPRVINLEDMGVTVNGGPPTQSYEKELWNLFRSVPNYKDLQKEARSGAQLQHTLALQEEIERGWSEIPGLDAHSLARLRMADRHGLGRVATTTTPIRDTATVRLEFWKKQPNKNPSPDPSRMVLEFLADQTLLDVHLAVIDMLEDYAFEKDSIPSGCFFIEGIFYKHGPIDYVTPIVEWLDGGANQPPSQVRRGYLGIYQTDPLCVKPMADTRLGEISMRLGVRYYHACHGDVEISMFLVDRALTSKQTIPYPILHDIWTNEKTDPVCDSCKSLPALLAVKAAPQTDNIHRFLCETCSKQLQIDPSSIQLLAVWAGEETRSASLATAVTRIF